MSNWVRIDPNPNQAGEGVSGPNSQEFSSSRKRADGPQRDETPDLQRPSATTLRLRRVTALVVILALVVAAGFGSYFVTNRWVWTRAKRNAISQSETSLIPLSDSSPAAIPSGGLRIALVIGNGRYRYVPALTNPRNDARLIARTLHDLGFTIVDGGAQLDLEKDSLERVLQDFSKKLRGASVALFFYAGHGLQMAGDNFLVPVSANPETPSDVNLQMVDAQVILEMMQDAGARLNIVILDACRNNPFGGRGLQRALTHGLAEMQAPEGTLIAYATQPGAVASDGAGADSPYTAALAQVMRRRAVEVRQVFNDVGLIVNKETGGSQTPWMANSPISGFFYFAGQPVAAPSPTSAQAVAAPSPTSAQAVAAPSPSSGHAVATYIPYAGEAEITFWDSIKDSKDQRDFRAYLRQFPHGQFKFLADARLVELASPTPGAAVTPLILPTDVRREQGSMPETGVTETPALAHPLFNQSLSDNLSDYLHRGRFPFVNASVLSDQTGQPLSLELSGRVRTEMGRRDAVLKSRNFLGSANLQVTNSIVVDPKLTYDRLASGNEIEATASPSGGYGDASAGRTAAVSAAPSTVRTPAGVQILQTIPAPKPQVPNSTPIQVAYATVPQFSSLNDATVQGNYIVVGDPVEQVDAELLEKRFERFGYHPSLVRSGTEPNQYSLKFGPYSRAEVVRARDDLLSHWHDLTFHLIVNSSAGSWMDGNAADGAAETIKRLGANPILVSRDLNDQVRYEVEIGPFVTEQEAMSAGEMLGDKYTDSLNCPWGNCNWQYTWSGAPPRLLCPDATRACKPDE